MMPTLVMLAKKIAKDTMQKASPGVTFVNNVSLYDWFEIYVVVSFELLQRQQKTVTPWTIPSAGIVKIKDTN